MENKDYKIIMIIIICLSIVTIGGTFAYFYAVVTGSGNTTNNETSTTAISLGTINYDGQLTFDGTNIYPGYYGIQTFTISPGSQNGIGRYEIDLASTLPTEFGSDVEITLLKTTDPTNNYLTRTSGTLTRDGEKYYQEDTITETGKLTIVYESNTLESSSKIILERTANNFTIPGFNATTYYLVYHYINNGNQNTQEGKTFSGKVTVKLLPPYNYGSNAISILKNLESEENQDLKYDGTSDNNLRYIGSNPNNYIDIGDQYLSDIYIVFKKWGEYNFYSSLDECVAAQGISNNCKKAHNKGDKILWSIIGAMNNVDNGIGTKESRLKIIRNESIGSYSWDSSESTINSGYGINEWSQADLMTELNSGPYWNRTSGICYNGQNNASVACDFSSIGLNGKAQLIIDNVIWNTGSQGNNEYPRKLADKFYIYERSNNNGKICTSGTYCDDTVSRTTSWIGKVGLMYPSDFLYADKQIEGFCWIEDLVVSRAWTITPYATTSAAAGVNEIMGDSVGVANAYASEAYNIHPVVYLSSTVKITSGTGTSTDPFIVSL